jgi:hypothetical protein
MMEALRPSKISVLTRATGCSILEDGILLSHYQKNPFYYFSFAKTLIQDVKGPVR